MFKNALSTAHRMLKNSTGFRALCTGPPVALNGIGRIGKSVLRQSFDANVNIVAVNQPKADIKAVANALMYDTVYGTFNKKVKIYNDTLCIDGRHVKVFHEENVEKIKWKDVPIEYVIDSSGKCDENQKAMKHIQAGAKKVLTTTLSKDIPMFIKGRNFETYKKSVNVVSCGSSTGNCATLLVQILHKKFGVLNCMMSTTHPLSPNQHVHDGLGFKSGVGNIMSSSTGAAVAFSSTFPDLKDKVHADAARVPVLNVSLLKIFMNVKEKVTVDAIKADIVSKVQSELKDVLNYVDDSFVSSDFIGCQYSGVVDFHQIQVIDNLISIGVWYDNEMGYACRVLDLVKHMAEVDAKSTK
ncbi:Glyceraldehyde 3-phosphate dehydrogenase, catalytic domain,Glyceraldehyde/Erythrose phosphate [Cinara cedri]|uniref:Glyceraldehyde 3-phosphate dehydrogenase, catalytic domain,Glyceraldehyde/Erythrose phosphate n=1 Tax=Cinara cedri TaxID=506608 RepID=A0A5E4MX42_9HEMI|nr:Glyceraldehyde 3-phosphate dehydrogenase, catalytic domain,Glyceraldehyde/Erythrose phosphate [Cinara cedri]